MYPLLRIITLNEMEKKTSETWNCDLLWWKSDHINIKTTTREWTKSLGKRKIMLLKIVYTETWVDERENEERLPLNI